MYCVHCGVENVDYANFCSNCGKELNRSPTEEVVESRTDEPQSEVRVHHPWMGAQEQPKEQAQGEVPNALKTILRRVNGWSTKKKILWGMVALFLFLICVGVLFGEPVENSGTTTVGPVLLLTGIGSLIGAAVGLVLGLVRKRWRVLKYCSAIFGITAVLYVILNIVAPDRSFEESLNTGQTSESLRPTTTPEPTSTPEPPPIPDAIKKGDINQAHWFEAPDRCNFTILGGWTKDTYDDIVTDRLAISAVQETLEIEDEHLPTPEEVELLGDFLNGTREYGVDDWSTLFAIHFEKMSAPMTVFRTIMYAGNPNNDSAVKIDQNVSLLENQFYCRTAKMREQMSIETSRTEGVVASTIVRVTATLPPTIIPPAMPAKINATATPEPFRIGVMEAITGPGETYGNVAVQAKQMAVDEINAAGGVSGRLIELIVEDEKCNAHDAITAYRKLTDVYGVKIILGTTCSGAMLGATPLAEEEGIIMFSGLATNPDIANAGDYIFRTSMSDGQVGVDKGNVLWEDGIRMLATITEATYYAEDVTRTSVAQFEKRGGQIVGEERYASDVTDFRSQLTKLLNANPDGLHVAAQSEFTGGTIVKQTRDLGYEGPIYSDIVSIGPTALEIAGDAATGMKAITADLDPANSKAQEVIANFRERYGYVTLQWYLGSAYDDVYITAACLKQTEDDQDADGFKDCLYGITWSGAIGNNYSFDENGEVVGLVNVVVEVLPTSDRTGDNQGYKVLGPAPSE